MRRNFIIAITCMILPFFCLAQIDTTSKNKTDTTIKQPVDTTIKSTADTTAKPKSTRHGFAFGIKLGLNYNKISGLEYSEGYKPGFHFGCFFEIGKKTIGFQPELLFSMAGTRISNDTASDFEKEKRIKLSYFQVPLLLRINLGKMFTLHVGPQFGILLNKGENGLESGQSAFKVGDFAMDLGAQVNIGNLRIYGRYNIGLNDISDLENQESWKNQVLQLGLGIKIF